MKKLFKSLENFYCLHISKEDRAWLYLRKKISKDFSIEELNQWIKKSNIDFNSYKYSELLQISILKHNQTLSNHLLDNYNFIYPYVDIPNNRVNKTMFIDSIMTNGLLYEDHAAWLALMISHDPLFLLSLKKEHNPQDYYNITKKLFFNQVFKPLYLDEKRRTNILNNCPSQSKSMFQHIFFEMDLNTKNKKEKVKKI